MSGSSISTKPLTAIIAALLRHTNVRLNLAEMGVGNRGKALAKSLQVGVFNCDIFKVPPPLTTLKFTHTQAHTHPPPTHTHILTTPHRAHRARRRCTR